MGSSHRANAAEAGAAHTPGRYLSHPQPSKQMAPPILLLLMLLGVFFADTRLQVFSQVLALLARQYSLFAEEDLIHQWPSSLQGCSPGLQVFNSEQQPKCLLCFLL